MHRLLRVHSTDHAQDGALSMLLLSKLCDPVALPLWPCRLVSSKLPQPRKRATVSEDHTITIECAACSSVGFISDSRIGQQDFVCEMEMFRWAEQKDGFIDKGRLDKAEMKNRKQTGYFKVTMGWGIQNDRKIMNSLTSYYFMVLSVGMKGLQDVRAKTEESQCCVN